MEPDKDFNLTVGLRIREIRESRNLTRADFCLLCDISCSFLSAVENGKKSITSRTIYKLCRGANISADYLILGHNTDFVSDAAIELLKNMPSEERGHALRILQEYSSALKRSG